jgi:hypothetical protein
MVSPSNAKTAVINADAPMKKYPGAATGYAVGRDASGHENDSFMIIT